MRKLLQKISILNLLAIFLVVGTTVQAQNRPYKVRDSQVQYILNRIESRTDTYKREMNKALDRSPLNNTDDEDLVMDYITNFENATDLLKQRFDAKESVVADVEDVLTRAAYINRFMKNNPLNASAQTNWRYLSTDLNTLARYYGITGDWRTVPVAQTNQKPYRVSDSQVKTLLDRIETRTDQFKNSLNRALDRSRLNGTDREDAVINFVADFEKSTDALKQRFDDNQSVSADVQDVLTKAYYIDRFILENNLRYRANTDWAAIRADLNTLANYYSVNWNWTTPPVNNNTAYNVSERTLAGLLTGIETRTDIFKREMNTALDLSVLNNTRSEDAIFSYITGFENSTDALKQNFDAKKSTVSDVEKVLNEAYYINNFMRDYRFTGSAENQWRLLRADLEKLRDYYNVKFDFETRQYIPQSRFDANITGTYRLNRAQSDNVTDVVSRAVLSYPVNQRNRIERNLERRLDSPEMLAIEKNNQNVSLASSNSPQISFKADGIARAETLPGGRSVKLTANTFYDGVYLNYEGDRINDFYINLMPLPNGQLRVVRRVFQENQNDTITVASVYDKVDKTAQWGMVESNQTATLETFTVPNNTRLTAVLDTPISTKASQDGDRFSMTVDSPTLYRGAVIEGRVATAERSGRVTGRANLSLEFDTIRLTNGKTYRFAGLVEEVSMPNGDKISVNNEGTVRDDSQTAKTVTRAGIGAALGALIGAITSGGKGAAIGAAIGAGAGAGTVVLEGRDDIELVAGTGFVLTATAPANTAGNP